MTEPVDYDRIASSYDRRYEQHDYGGVRQAVLEFVGAGSERAVLEVGCGTGRWLGLVEPHADRLAGVDPSRAMLGRARAAVPATALVRGLAEALPWSAATFDRLFCVNAIHHFADPVAFVAEARRVLRPGGGLLAIALDPHLGPEPWWIYEWFPEAVDADLDRYPATADLRQWMEDAGFTGVATTEVQHVAAEVPFREALDRGLLERTSASQLMVIDDAAYERGMRRLRDAREQLGEDEALMLRADLRLRGTVGWVDGTVRTGSPLTETAR